jgi:hypothetical protein
MLVMNATNASQSNFFGYYAGNGATNALTQVSLGSMLGKMQQVLMVKFHWF